MILRAAARDASCGSTGRNATDFIDFNTVKSSTGTVQAAQAQVVAETETAVHNSTATQRISNRSVAVVNNAASRGATAAPRSATAVATATTSAAATATRGTRPGLNPVAARVLALLAALLVAAALLVTPSGTAHAAATTDVDTWAEVAEGTIADINDGVQKYADGNMAGAASSFNTAYNTDYVATNFAKVVNDTIGEDRYTSQQSQFQELRSLAYQQDAQSDIESVSDGLIADLTECAATLDANADLNNPRDYAQAREDQTAAEREELDANKVNVNEGRGDRTWSDVAEEMVDVLDEALATAEGGDGEGGADLVNNAYYQYYEKLGFEKNVMNAIGGDRVSLVENTFKQSRKAMIAGEDATEYVTNLQSYLVEDAAELDGGAGDDVSGFTSFATSSIGQAFLILIREGLEALLVVAAIIAYLVKSGNRRLVKWIYLGVVLGLAGSGLIAVLFTILFGGSGPQQEIMEGVCALVAMCMLLYTSNWMLSKSSTKAWNQYIRAKTESAVANVKAVQGGSGAVEKVTAGSIASLTMLSFLAVFREGAETVIFYQSIYSMTEDSAGMWIGGIAAAVVLVVIFLVFRFTSVKLPIGPFFTVTSVLLAIMVVVFAGGGVHSLIEGDLIDGTYLPTMPTNDWIGLYPYVETLVAQGIALVAVIALFVVGFIRQRRAKRAELSAEQSADRSA